MCDCRMKIGRIKLSGLTAACAVLLVSLTLSRVYAGDAGFLYNIPVLDKAAIQKLSDEELVDRFIDVMIELEASKTFHETSGFSKPDEYNKFKGLLRYRTDLLIEIQRRELAIPKIQP